LWHIYSKAVLTIPRRLYINSKVDDPCDFTSFVLVSE
jgi:hypothetical protein